MTAAFVPKKFTWILCKCHIGFCQIQQALWTAQQSQRCNQHNWMTSKFKPLVEKSCFNHQRQKLGESASSYPFTKQTQRYRPDSTFILQAKRAEVRHVFFHRADSPTVCYKFCFSCPNSQQGSQPAAIQHTSREL